MRERRWVLVIALLLTLLILAVYFFWRVTRADEIIRQKLLASVRPFLAQDSDIENLEMDLNGVHLKGVKVIPKNRSFTLDIDEVQLGYHLWNFDRAVHCQDFPGRHRPGDPFGYHILRWDLCAGVAQSRSRPKDAIRRFLEREDHISGRTLGSRTACRHYLGRHLHRCVYRHRGRICGLFCRLCHVYVE